MTDTKALIVLDLKGVLVDRVHKTNGRFLNTEFDFMTPNGYYVFVRPYTKRFLMFLFQNFDVAIRSSMKKHNTAFVLERILTKTQRAQLVFEYHDDLPKTFVKMYYPNALIMDNSPSENVSCKKFTYTDRYRDYELERVTRFLKRNLEHKTKPSVVERVFGFINRYWFS